MYHTPPANIQVLIRLKLLQSESRVSQKITQNGKQVGLHPILFNMVIFMTNKSVIKALQPYPTHHYSPKTKKQKTQDLYSFNVLCRNCLWAQI